MSIYLANLMKLMTKVNLILYVLRRFERSGSSKILKIGTNIDAFVIQLDETYYPRPEILK